MNHQQSRLISFAGSSIRLTYDAPPLARMIDFLFEHIPASHDNPPHVNFQLTATGAPAYQYALIRDATQIYEGDSLAKLADILLGSSCYHLADQSRGGTLFHGGALVLNGKGIMLPGTMGAGKTTLCAWLLARGFDYLTDELVFVPEETDTIQAFHRPLNLKRLARPALMPYIDFETQADNILSTSHVDLLSPSLLRPGNRLSEPPLRLIIFPHYRPGTRFELVPFSKAQAGKALMECLINARNLTGHGFAEIIRLAHQTPAYTMIYQNFEQVGDTVEELARAIS